MSDDELGIGDIVTSIYSPSLGNGIVVDSAPERLHVLFDDDYDDWFHPLELRELAKVQETA